jgi:hypothetical protein
MAGRCRSLPLWLPGRIIEQRRLAESLALHLDLRTARIEPQPAVPNDLSCDAADLGRRRTSGSVVDRCQRQQSANLVGVFALTRRQPEPRCVRSRAAVGCMATLKALRRCVESDRHRVVGQAPRVRLYKLFTSG